MSSMMALPAVLGANAVLFAVACALSAWLGVRTRKSKTGRWWKGGLVALFLPWMLLVDPGGFAFEPSIRVIYVIYPHRNDEANQQSPQLQAFNRRENSIALGLASFLILTSFGCFGFFSNKVDIQGARA